MFEKKFIDSSDQLTAVAGGTVEAEFFNCIIGNTPTRRIGNKITVTNINMRGIVTSGSVNDAAGTVNECPTFRIIIGIDKQANGAAPAIFSSTGTGILQGNTVGGFTDCLQYRNMFNLERFTILKDKLICSKAASSGTTGNFRIDTAIPWKFSWKGMLPVSFGSDNGTIADLRSNNLFVAVIPDRAPTGGASSTNGTVEFVTRVKFIDA